jgi:hypothetical protein
VNPQGGNSSINISTISRVHDFACFTCVSRSTFSSGAVALYDTIGHPNGTDAMEAADELFGGMVSESDSSDDDEENSQNTSVTRPSRTHTATQRYTNGGQPSDSSDESSDFDARGALRMLQRAKQKKRKKREVEASSDMDELEDLHCPTCGKEFSRKGNLNRHMKIHTSNKKHMCEMCGKRFREK